MLRTTNNHCEIIMVLGGLLFVDFIETFYWLNVPKPGFCNVINSNHCRQYVSVNHWFWLPSKWSPPPSKILMIPQWPIKANTDQMIYNQIEISISTCNTTGNYFIDLCSPFIEHIYYAYKCITHIPVVWTQISYAK